MIHDRTALDSEAFRMSEWLDSQGLISRVEDERTHEDLAAAFIAQDYQRQVGGVTSTLKED